MKRVLHQDLFNRDAIHCFKVHLSGNISHLLILSLRSDTLEKLFMVIIALLSSAVFKECCVIRQLTNFLLISKNVDTLKKNHIYTICEMSKTRKGEIRNPCVKPQKEEI